MICFPQDPRHAACCVQCVHHRIFSMPCLWQFESCSVPCNILLSCAWTILPAKPVLNAGLFKVTSFGNSKALLDGTWWILSFSQTCFQANHSWPLRSIYASRPAISALWLDLIIIFPAHTRHLWRLMWVHIRFVCLSSNKTGQIFMAFVIQWFVPFDRRAQLLFIPCLVSMSNIFISVSCISKVPGRSLIWQSSSEPPSNKVVVIIRYRKCKISI